MTSRNRKFLIFSLQDLLYALDLAQVAEVGDPPQMWPIPLAPKCYSGVISFHGDIVAVMNLAIFLGLAGPGKTGRIIVLQQEVASLAFLVDTVVKIVLENDVSISPPPNAAFTAATLGLIDGEAILLDINSLVHEAEANILKSQQTQ
jgi:purine-binding chemotaxis protein CheW